MRKTFFKFGMILLSAVGFSCSSQDEMNLKEDPDIIIDEEKPEEEEVVQQVQNWDRVSIDLSTPEMAVAQKQYEFPVNLLSAAIESSKQGNIMVSPLSASMVLGMLTHAIDDYDRDEIWKILNVKPEEEEAFLSYMNKLMVSLPEMDNHSTFFINNAFWHIDKAIISDSYSNILCQNYLSETSSFPVFNEAVVDEVNDWVKEKTKGGIEKILYYSDISELIYTVWANTIFFKGSWIQCFDKESTMKVPFYPNFPDTALLEEIDMMAGYNFRYRDYYFPGPSQDYDDAITTVMLPYGNESFIFTAILPAVNNPDIRATLNELDADFWKRLDKVCSYEIKEPGDVMVKLPKMSMESSNNLVPALKLMGLKNIFEKVQMKQNLDLEDQRISLIRQKVVLDVDEKGTEIKAATVIAGEASAGPPTITEFNRPFIYFVRERSTGAVLLAGVYNGPESNN